MPEKPPPSPRDTTDEPDPMGSTVDPQSATSTGEGDEPAAVRRERDEYRDWLLRKTAEFDNYRKRIERERREAEAVGTTDLLHDLLPIVDDFERALEADAGPDAEAYREGVELIYRQLLDVLRKRGVKPMEVVGQDFNPHVHQAVAHEVSPDHPEGEIIAELRRGYTVGDRLLRPAMVKVAKT